MIKKRDLPASLVSFALCLSDIDGLVSYRQTENEFQAGTKLHIVHASLYAFCPATITDIVVCVLILTQLVRNKASQEPRRAEHSDGLVIYGASPACSVLA